MPPISPQSDFGLVILVLAAVAVFLVLARPDFMLQAIGLLLFVSAPVGIAIGGVSGFAAAITGLLMIGLGRLLYSARTILRTIRAAHPEAAEKVKVPRWLF